MKTEITGLTLACVTLVWATLAAPALAADDEPVKGSAAPHARHGEVLEQEKATAAAMEHRSGKEGRPAGHAQGNAGGHGPGAGHPQGIGMHHDFSDAERWAKVFDDPARAEWQKPQEVVGLMAIEPGMQVADIGAGTGYFLGYLAAAVGGEGRVLGLDPEQNMVDYMNTKAEQAGWSRVRAKVIPFDSPNLAAGSTDRILIVDTWHHIENRVDYTRKLAEALAQNGAVYVVDFTLESPVGPAKDHRLAAEKVMAELKEGGLEVELLAEALPNQYIVRGKKPGCDCGAPPEE